MLCTNERTALPSGASAISNSSTTSTASPRTTSEEAAPRPSFSRRAAASTTGESTIARKIATKITSNVPPTDTIAHVSVASPTKIRIVWGAIVIDTPDRGAAAIGRSPSAAGDGCITASRVSVIGPAPRRGSACVCAPRSKCKPRCGHAAGCGLCARHQFCCPIRCEIAVQDQPTSPGAAPTAGNTLGASHHSRDDPLFDQSNVLEGFRESLGQCG
jgi:hypothetical protein